MTARNAMAIAAMRMFFLLTDSDMPYLLELNMK